MFVCQGRLRLEALVAVIPGNKGVGKERSGGQGKGRVT